MPLETETVLDRRRLRRSMSFWRAAAVAAGVLALAVLGYAANGARGDSAGGMFERNQIARVSIEGLITENRQQLALLKRLGEKSTVSAVILYVNSPGGTTTGGEALFEAIRALSAKKPVIAQFGTLATSAAYIAGLATDRIFAHGNTITGSVGVIFQWPEFTELLAKVGVKMNEVKSGTLKAEPSPYHPMDQAGKETTERMVAESMGWFRGLVADRRKIDPESVPGLIQGRIFSGREALGYKMIDAIGGEGEVVEYLVENRGVAKGLKVVDWKPRTVQTYGLFGMAGSTIAGWLMQRVGLDGALHDDGHLAGLAASGLVSVWHPVER